MSDQHRHSRTLSHSRGRYGSPVAGTSSCNHTLDRGSPFQALLIEVLLIAGECVTPDLSSIFVPKFGRAYVTAGPVHREPGVPTSPAQPHPSVTRPTPGTKERKGHKTPNTLPHLPCPVNSHFLTLVFLTFRSPRFPFNFHSRCLESKNESRASMVQPRAVDICRVVLAEAARRPVMR